MKLYYPLKTLRKSLVKPFYRENSSLFLFLFVVMFGIVGEVDGAEIWQFHFSLALGLLEHQGYLWLVFIAWFLYARKCAGFVIGLLRKPEYTFLTIYTSLSSRKLFALFAYVTGWLLLPVLLYTLFIVVYGCIHHLYSAVLVVGFFLLLLWAGMAGWVHFCLSHRYDRRQWSWRFPLSSLYPVILLRSVARKQGIMWLGIKLFTCGCVYGIALNNTWDDYDRVFPFLFFFFGLLANGIVVFGIREFEETVLSFYRGAPVALFRRWRQYALVYFVLLIPEFVTVVWLTPVHLHTVDMFCFCGCAYALLLLMHSISCRRYFPPKELLRVLLLIFAVGYIFMAGIGLGALFILLLAGAVAAFFPGYYRYEREMN